jgi:hypothetical protein
MSRNVVALGLLAGLAIALAGCGGGVSDEPETVPAKGTLMIDGKPPTMKMSIAFTPTDGKKLAAGETDEQGNFVLKTNETLDGAVPGTYNVSVTHIYEVTEAMPGMDGYKPPPPSPVAKKFTDPKTSGLSFTVDKDPSKNDFKIDVTSKAK